MTTPDFIWTAVGFVLTFFILSYLFGDNPLFKVAVYILVGVSAGYLLTVVVHKVLIARMIAPFISGDPVQKVLVLVPMLLGAMLLFKLSPRLGRLGNIPMGFLVGAGTAVLIGGALFGTLFPQIGSSINLFRIHATSMSSLVFQVVGACFVLIGTVSTLIYFQFGVKPKSVKPQKRPGFFRILGKIGEVFIAITLGAVFTGVLLASLTMLVDRLSAVWNTISLLIR